MLSAIRLCLMFCVGAALTKQCFGQFQFTLSAPSTTTEVLPKNPQEGGYDYVPTGMLDGKHRFWWCGSRYTDPGDNIFYGESDSLRSLMSPRPATPSLRYAPVKLPRYREGVTNAFDAGHLCDPSVIRVPPPDGSGNGDYLLYYSGNPFYPRRDAQGNFQNVRDYPGEYGTEIGVLRSRDGITWQRENGGRSILASFPGRLNAGGANRPYGTGQPSVVYKDGYIYLSYKDDSGIGGVNAGDTNGGGMYVLRSKDYLFLNGVEALTANGFVPIENRNPNQPETPTRYAARTTYRLENYSVSSVDWQFSDMLQAFIIANNASGGRMEIIVVRLEPFPQTLFVGNLFFGLGYEGPGTIRRPDGHSLAAFGGETVDARSCGRVPLEIVDAFVPAPNSDISETRLGVFTAELKVGPPNCAPWHWSGMLNGYQMLSAGLPLALVVDQVRLQTNSSAPFPYLSRNAVTVSPDVYNAVPFGANLYFKDPYMSAPGRPAAFLLQSNPPSPVKDAVWPVSCGAILSANQSPPLSRTKAQFDAAASARFGKPLFCIQ